ncbi:uncharacterized protein [Rutidosis leptorrhynchoides]|uniref:uncharacterized protein n=1 Tax=Rutidosis leptorrhynchoides TaxID=125765 RepID=UPI003A99F0F0
MPKTVTDMKSKSKPRRKPLRDVSNKTSLTTSTMKSKFLNTQQQQQQQQQQQSVTTCGGGDGCSDSFDRLLLAHSNLSTLIHQIDELVVQAVEQKVKNTKEIESFTDVLKEMQTSLKPWIPRFQKVFMTQAVRSKKSLETSITSTKIAPINRETSKGLDSPYIDKFDFLVSPSPLVSWRADCAAEGGRNLFMLTPIPRPTPFTSKLNKPSKSKSVLKQITTDVSAGPVDSVFSSPEKLISVNDTIVVSTPYIKMSPPKSCIIMEPASECWNKTNAPKNSTMHSRHLTLKYPELFGIRSGNKLGNVRKMAEASPNWCMPISPPKTCVLLEPNDDKIKDVRTNVPKAGGFTSAVSCNEVIESTPICKDLDTTILKGKRAGENTLKKELWTRFEAATGHGFHLKASVNQETSNNNDDSRGKGFMDLLEEVSCDEEKF